MKADVLFIKQLAVEIIIGVLPHERNSKQKIFFDLEFIIDTRQIAATDNLRYTVDYQNLTQRFINFINATEFQLIETLAETAATFLLQEFSLSWLKLTLYKPAALADAATVGVVIERP